MKKLTSEILPIIAFVAIISPVVSSIRKNVKTEEKIAPPRAEVVAASEPVIIKQRETDPAAWFASIRPRCTPAEVRLATDLNRPPEGVEGVGYEAACFALAHQVPKARAILLGMSEDDRLRGASVVFDVAEQLAERGRRDVAGPLMELVLEFWPNHYMALYQAGSARYAAGDLVGAQDYLARFLDANEGSEEMVANAQRMISYWTER